MRNLLDKTRITTYGTLVMNLRSDTAKSIAPQPWDFVGIVRAEGFDGLRRRYYALASFAELVHAFGDAQLFLPTHWYRSPAICMTLAALQAQWAECNSPQGKAWVASRFWTQDLLCLKDMCKHSGVDNPDVVNNTEKPLPSLAQYLDGEEFQAVYRTLRRLVQWEDQVQELYASAGEAHP